MTIVRVPPAKHDGFTLRPDSFSAGATYVRLPDSNPSSPVPDASGSPADACLDVPGRDESDRSDLSVQPHMAVNAQASNEPV